MTGYWTIVIPFVPPEFRTAWHPAEESGPFSTLVRGEFASVEEAIRWGRDYLKGTPYTIRHEV